MAQIVYLVPKLHLTETKRVNFDRVTANNMSRFIIGKFYGVPNQEAFLNGACIRDVVLNGEYIFKTNPFMSLNPHVTLPVKYGCDHHDNSCGVSDKCVNNSTCIHRWYTYECTECQLPFYGSYCHIETQKLGFIQPLSELVLVSDTSSQSISNMFKIFFNLSRNQNDQTKSEDIFLNFFRWVIWMRIIVKNQRKGEWIKWIFILVWMVFVLIVIFCNFSCFELNGSVGRMGFNRLLTSKTINCSRQDEDPRINQCKNFVG